MVVLGQVKRAQGQDLRGDRFAALGGFALTAFQGQFLLAVALVEDSGQVLPAAVVRTRIVRGPENLQQLRISNLGRVEIELERLGVIAEAMVSRILGVAARVTDARANDAGQTPELRVGVPESTQGESRRLGLFGHVHIDRRQASRGHGRSGATAGRQQESPGQALHGSSSLKDLLELVLHYSLPSGFPQVLSQQAAIIS